MLGAIAGDIIGSPYTQNNIQSAEFPLLSEDSSPTSITVQTLALAFALIKTMKAPDAVPSVSIFSEAAEKYLRKFGRRFRKIGHDKKFWNWLRSKTPQPYKTCDISSAARVSAIAWAFNDLWTVERFAEVGARVTHRNADAVKGAAAVACCVFLARTGRSKAEIRSYAAQRYGYDLSRSLDEIREGGELCGEIIPQAITAFLEGENFEEAVRLAVSLGGNSEILASIAGAISEAMYGINIALEVDIFEHIKGKLRFYTECWEQWRN